MTNFIFSTKAGEAVNFTQLIHKVVRYLSTFLYARSIAFVHLSTYTTTATI